MAKGNKAHGGLERRLNAPFQKLRKALGQKVEVYTISDRGLSGNMDGILKNVEDYIDITIAPQELGRIIYKVYKIPFISFRYGKAIQKITNEKGNILYENKYFPDQYEREIYSKYVHILNVDTADFYDEMMKNMGEYLAKLGRPDLIMMTHLELYQKLYKKK